MIEVPPILYQQESVWNVPSNKWLEEFAGIKTPYKPHLQGPDVDLCESDLKCIELDKVLYVEYPNGDRRKIDFQSGFISFDGNFLTLEEYVHELDKSYTEVLVGTPVVQTGSDEGGESNQNPNNNLGLYTTTVAGLLSLLWIYDRMKSSGKKSVVDNYLKPSSNLNVRDILRKVQVDPPQIPISDPEMHAPKPKRQIGESVWTAIEYVQPGDIYEGHRVLAVDSLTLLGKTTHFLHWGGGEGKSTAVSAIKGSGVIITTGSLRREESVVSPLEIDRPFTYDRKQIISVEPTSTTAVWVKLEGEEASHPFTANTQMIVSTNDPKIIEGKFKKE